MLPRLRAVLALGLAAVAVPGLVAEVVHYVAPGLAPGDDVDAWVGLLSLSYENNIPTWYSSCLLFACAMALYSIAGRAFQEKARFRGHWAALAGIFAYMSMDEAVGFHEHGNSIAELHGIFYFAWVIPASLVVTAIGLAYLGFLRNLPRKTRWGFMIAGAIYVTGALVMELPLGYWADQAGEDNLIYALIDFVEEFLEMGGASLFLIALHEHRDEVSTP